MEIKDLKPVWESFKLRNALMEAHLYDAQRILELLEPHTTKPVSQRIIGAGVMLALIFMFCQGG